MFKPTMRKPSAVIRYGIPVRNNIYRFRAEISSKAAGWKDAVKEALGGNVRLNDTMIKRHSNVSTGIEIEGWCVASVPTFYVDKKMLAKKLHDMGTKQVARNMYMDEDETVWHVKMVGENAVITKSGTDDISEIFEKAMLAKGRPPKMMNSPLSEVGIPAKVAFVNENAETQYGIAFASVEGDSNLVEILPQEDAPNPIVASKLQVIAAEDVDTSMMEIDEDEVLSYWRQVYSNDPDMMTSLENMIRQSEV